MTLTVSAISSAMAVSMVTSFTMPSVGIEVLGVERARRSA
jgi:hypothetical protein